MGTLKKVYARPMGAHKQRRGLLASLLLVIVLAITTFISTEFKAWQLNGLGSSDNSTYGPLLESFDVGISRSVASRKSTLSTNVHGRHSTGDGDDFRSRPREKSSHLPGSNEGSAGIGLAGNQNYNDKKSHGGESIGNNHESMFKESSFIKQNEASIYNESDDDEMEDDDETDDDDDAIDDNVDGEMNDEDEIDDEDSKQYEKYAIESDPVWGELSPQIKHILANNTEIRDKNELTSSPACHPHFHLSLPNNRWNNTTKFRRIYFYHARKAGGSSMHKYLAKVCRHYGLELKAVEWTGMEEPGMKMDKATFYVTHLREPVSRSISHFKYQGRWNCKYLSYKKRSFIPTEENANKIETWNQTGGHVPSRCHWRGSKKSGRKRLVLWLGMCAVNCYTQWFSGICPEYGISVNQQYRVAKAKLLKYNLVVVIEKLRDPEYARAVEEFFGVPGVTERGDPFCERHSHNANAKVPLIVRNETLDRLTRLNQVDTRLYNEMSDCLDEGQYDFPKWDPSRWELNSTYWRPSKWERAKAAKRVKAKKEAKEGQS